MLSKIADNQNKKSLSNNFRQKRFAYFLSFINKLVRPLKILDIGGTEEFWEMMEFAEGNIHITLLNLEEKPTKNSNFTSVKGDATNLQYEDNTFDVVFSNSVIEHLFTKENQQLMAKEAERVGKFYFIQTPNYYFPLEPHWLFPFFQFLPFPLRVFLTRNFNLGHIGKVKDKERAKRQVEEVKLLTGRQFRGLFNKSNFYREKILFLTKSFIVHNFNFKNNE